MSAKQDFSQPIELHIVTYCFRSPLSVRLGDTVYVSSIGWGYEWCQRGLDAQCVIHLSIHLAIIRLAVVGTVTEYIDMIL